MQTFIELVLEDIPGEDLTIQRQLINAMRKMQNYLFSFQVRSYAIESLSC